MRIRIKMKLFLFTCVFGFHYGRRTRQWVGELTGIKGPVPVAQNSGCVEWQHSRGQHATSNRKDKGYCTSSYTGDRAVPAGSSQVCFPDSSEERLLARRKHLQSRVTGG